MKLTSHDDRHDAYPDGHFFFSWNSETSTGRMRVMLTAVGAVTGAVVGYAMDGLWVYMW